MLRGIAVLNAPDRASELLTVADAMAELRCSESTVRRLCGASGPYRLLTTEDPNRTFGEADEAGDVRHYATMIEAANAFVKATEAYKTVVFDDGCQARELNQHERRLLANVCAKLGYEVEEVEG